MPESVFKDIYFNWVMSEIRKNCIGCDTSELIDDITNKPFFNHNCKSVDIDLYIEKLKRTNPLNIGLEYVVNIENFLESLKKEYVIFCSE